MKKIWGIVLFSFLLVGCNSIQSNYNKKIPAIDGINANRQHVDESIFTNKISLVYVFFTSCATICSPMTMNLAALQKEMNEHGVTDYQIVGLTVDPQVDSPEQLTTFIKRIQPVDREQWTFITGYKEETIQQFAKEAFQMIVKRDQANQFVHGSQLYLVDRKGVIRKVYAEGLQLPKDEIMHDVKLLGQQ